jgi:hypothetical protein
MRSTRICLALSCSFLLAGLAAHAQSSRKPGLYEVTSTMSFGGASMPQMPPGAQMPGGGNPMAAAHTMQVCVTQAMIDKYGGPNPAPQRGTCEITDMTLKPDGMKAKISCTGQMTATGTVESTWTAEGTGKSTVHITGTMGQSARPMDITMQSSTVYKGADCGSVQPIQMPAAK